RHTRSYGDWSSDVCSSDLRDVQRRTEISKSLRLAGGGYSSSQRRIMGQFSPDLLHGRVGAHRDAAIAQLGGSILARIVVVSNRRSEERRVGKEGRCRGWAC